MKTVDLLRVLSRFEHFRPDKLLFTKLDETGRPGAIWSLAAKSQLAVSFLTTGQRIPEDIEEASLDSIVDRIIPRASAPVNPAAQEAAAGAARAA
jgi:flagellar biosynthesis protein FlhF